MAITDFQSPAGDFMLDWTISGADITFTVTAQTTGYASFGINPFPYMAGADVYIGWMSGTTVGCPVIGGAWSCPRSHEARI